MVPEVVFCNKKFHNQTHRLPNFFIGLELKKKNFEKKFQEFVNFYCYLKRTWKKIILPSILKA